jgi:hypothetical protein
MKELFETEAYSLVVFARVGHKCLWVEAVYYSRQ